MKLRKNNDFRVLRGGSYVLPEFLRCSDRYLDSPASRGRYWNFGFRLVVRRQK